MCEKRLRGIGTYITKLLSLVTEYNGGLKVIEFICNPINVILVFVAMKTSEHNVLCAKSKYHKDDNSKEI